MTAKEILTNEYTVTEQQVLELWKRAKQLKHELETERDPARYVWIQDEARKTLSLIEELA